MKYLKLLKGEPEVPITCPKRLADEPSEPTKGVLRVSLGSPLIVSSPEEHPTQEHPAPTLWAGLEIEALADAIASAPRAPFEGDLAMARIARRAIEATRVVRELPTDEIRRAALVIGWEVSDEAATRIVKRDYQGAYELLDELPARLRRLIPQ
jgi:hypothetical protein